jgi:hypothetical protein
VIIRLGTGMTQEKANWRPAVGRWKVVPDDFFHFDDWKQAPKGYYRLAGKAFARFRRTLDRLDVSSEYIGTNSVQAWYAVHECAGYFKLELTITRHYCGGQDCDNWDSYRARLVPIDKGEYERLNSVKIT